MKPHPYLLTGLLALLALPLGVFAQQPQQPVRPQAPSPVQTPKPPPLGYTSAFESYRLYTEESTGNWKQANDTTARIGGWRAYAKEAAEEPAPAAANPPVKP